MDPAADLSVQLFTLRDAGPVGGVLDRLAGLGFRRVEPFGAHLADPGATRAALDAAGLAAPSAHVGVEDLRARPAAVAEAARRIGCRLLVVPALPEAERTAGPEALTRTGAALGALAEALAGEGLALAYHNHDWEFRPLPDGSLPFDRLLAGAAGSALRIQADLAWAARAGADPAAVLATIGPRLASVHVKDLAPAGTAAEEDGWAAIGAGTLRWPALWRQARALGADLMVLEHDRPRDPFAFAAAGLAWVRAHAGAAP